MAEQKGDTCTTDVERVGYVSVGMWEPELATRTAETERCTVENARPVASGVRRSA